MSPADSWSRNRLLISFQDFDERKEEIISQLLNAAEYAGFFTLVDHGISKEEIEAQFAISKAFFDLPPEDKAKTPHDPKTNNGWEYKVGGHGLPKEWMSNWLYYLGSIARQYWHLRPERIPLAATEFRMAKRWGCS